MFLFEQDFFRKPVSGLGLGPRHAFRGSCFGIAIFYQHDVIGSASVALARPRDWLYLNSRYRRAAATSVGSGRSPGWSPMAQPIFTPQGIPVRRAAPAVVVGGAGLGVAILLGALALWFHYGTAVFFETIASGIAACF
jgi:hypothetical protein